MNIITGATGFIGYRLLQQLLACGENVRCLVRPSSKTESLEKLPVEIVRVDFSDPESLAQAMRGAERTFHVAGCIAASTEAEMVNANCNVTDLLAETCSRLETPPTFLYVSSLAASGAEVQDGELREEWMRPQPVSIYGRSKIQAERLLRKRANDLPITIVRPPIVLGPGDRNSLALFKGIKQSNIHFCPGWKRKRFSIVLGDDVAQTMILASEKGNRLQNVPENYVPNDPSEAGIYNVSRDIHLEYGELGRAVGRALGKNRIFVKYTALPVFWTVCAVAETIGRVKNKPLILNLDKYREAAAGSWTASMKKIARELDFQPQGDFEDLLRQTADDYRKRGWL